MSSKRFPFRCDLTTFAPGDRVHFAGIGTGIVRQVRSGGRYVVEIKGRAVVATAEQLEPASGTRVAPKKSAVAASSHERSARVATTASIDLHGKTVDGALEALELFINDAILSGSDEVRVIHGRGGGRIKAAVHRYLRQLSGVATASLDPHNPGVTIVRFR